MFLSLVSKLQNLQNVGKYLSHIVDGLKIFLCRFINLDQDLSEIVKGFGTDVFECLSFNIYNCIIAGGSYKLLS